MADKEELEKQKLQAEIEEIKLKVKAENQRLDAERKDASRANLRSWAAIIISLITIVTGGFTIGEKFYAFLSQNEQAQKVKVSKEMIELVKGLNSNNENDRTNAILLLSAFEMDAVPVLLKNLESSDNPEPLIESLERIKERMEIKGPFRYFFPSRSKDFLNTLRKRAQEVFDQELKNLKTSDDATSTDISNHAYLAIMNYINALKRLDNKKNVEDLFQEWTTEIEKRQPIAKSVKEDFKQCFKTTK